MKQTAYICTVKFNYIIGYIGSFFFSCILSYLGNSLSSYN